MPPQIELVLQHVSLAEFQHFLADYFEIGVSLDNPIAVEYIGEAYSDRWFGIYDTGTYTIFGLTQDESEKSIQLAEITFREHNQLLIVFFRSAAEGSRWSKVENLVQKIIAKAQQLKFEIMSVEPKILIPDPWDRLEGRDKQYSNILKMWLDGSTNKEIGDLLGLHPRHVTNIISSLRQKYGEDIVLRDWQRREKLRKS